MLDLPVFVYGTLRPGASNYGHFLAGLTTHEVSATLHGAIMFDNGGFPYVTLSETGDVHGDLLWLDPATRTRTIRGLNMLEGYFGPNEPNHYDRVTVTVTTSRGESHQALTYVAGAYARDHLDRLPQIASGDWLNLTDRLNPVA